MPTGPTTLSVVLPVRNAEAYIGHALESLSRNARPDFQFVVIDDGSTDDTTAVIDDFRARLPMMDVIRHDDAVGLASARNVGLDAATGRLVTYLDGDDWIAPGYLPQLVDAVDGLACDFLRVDHVQVSGLVRTVHWAPEPRRDVVLGAHEGIADLHSSTMVDYPFAWAGVYRRDLGDLLRFPDGLRTAEDRPWIWRLHRSGASYAVPSVLGLFYRRLVVDSLTQIGDARQLDFLRSFELVLAEVRDHPDQHVKATKQLLAVLAHHLRESRRMSAPVVRELREGARALLATIPPDVLLPARLDARRHVLVRTLLPASLRWRVA